MQQEHKVRDTKPYTIMSKLCLHRVSYLAMLVAKVVAHDPGQKVRSKRH